MVKYNRPWVHWLTERASSARDIGHAVHIIYIIYMSWVMRQHIRIGHSSCKYSPSVWKQAHQHAVVMYSIPEPLFLTMTRRRRTRPSLVYRGPQNANYAHIYTQRSGEMREVHAGETTQDAAQGLSFEYWAAEVSLRRGRECAANNKCIASSIGKHKDICQDQKYLFN